MWDKRNIRVIVLKCGARPASMKMAMGANGETTWVEHEPAHPGTLVGVCLERYVTAQADTVEELRKHLEQLLTFQEIFDCKPNTVPTGPAPAEYQAVRDKGTQVIPDKKWAHVIGYSPVVDRFDIDMSKLEFTFTRKDGTVVPLNEETYKEIEHLWKPVDDDKEEG